MSLVSIVGKAAAQNDTALSKIIIEPLHAPPQYTKREAGMVAGLRALAVAGTSPHRTDSIKLVEDYLTREARKSGSAGGDRIPFWIHLNASPAYVARVFVDMVTSNPHGVLSNLPRVGKPGVGREGEFNGWLFQHYTLNHVVLHRDLLQISAQQVAELNRVLAVASGELMDALALPLNLSGSLGARSGPRSSGCRSLVHVHPATRRRTTPAFARAPLAAKSTAYGKVAGNDVDCFEEMPWPVRRKPGDPSIAGRLSPSRWRSWGFAHSSRRPLARSLGT
jgi:hypothetical protein